MGLVFLCCGPTHFRYTRFPVQASFPMRIIPVYVDEAFGNEDLIHIDDSIMRWNYALNGYIIMIVISTHASFTPEQKTDVYAHHGLMIHKTSSMEPNIPPQKNNELRTIAWTNMINGHEIFLIRDRLTTEDIFPVMLHELAHYLGADHKNEDGLMNKQYTFYFYQCIDLSTIRQVARFNKINSQDLNYCITCRD